MDVLRAGLAFASAEEDDPETPWDETETWDPGADLYTNGTIDVMDILQIAIHFGENYP